MKLEGNVCAGGVIPCVIADPVNQKREVMETPQKFSADSGRSKATLTLTFDRLLGQY